MLLLGLASNVQVAPPNTPDANEVKFNHTAEAGMNYGSAFPFTWLATLVASVLLLLGGSVIKSLSPLTLAIFLFCLVFVFVIRPFTAEMVLKGSGMTKGERQAVPFFGIKRIGSFYYLAFALGEEKFQDPDILLGPLPVVSFSSPSLSMVLQPPVLKRRWNNTKI